VPLSPTHPSTDHPPSLNHPSTRRPTTTLPASRLGQHRRRLADLEAATDGASARAAAAADAAARGARDQGSALEALRGSVDALLRQRLGLAAADAADAPRALSPVSEGARPSSVAPEGADAAGGGEGERLRLRGALEAHEARLGELRVRRELVNDSC
jgi:hypothetical protein